jgi:ankyrin repeat protein
MDENGLDVNITGPFGLTLLSMAAQTVNEASVQWLLESGAAINMQDEDGWTARHHASSSRGIC